jgi:hypothetical protein
MATDPTMHMITTLILLDEALALGARFGVGFNPGHIFS